MKHIKLGEGIVWTHPPKEADPKTARARRVVRDDNGLISYLVESAGQSVRRVTRDSDGNIASIDDVAEDDWPDEVR